MCDLLSTLALTKGNFFAEINSVFSFLSFLCIRIYFYNLYKYSDRQNPLCIILVYSFPQVFQISHIIFTRSSYICVLRLSLSKYLLEIKGLDVKSPRIRAAGRKNKCTLTFISKNLTLQTICTTGLRNVSILYLGWFLKNWVK